MIFFSPNITVISCQKKFTTRNPFIINKLFLVNTSTNASTPFDFDDYDYYLSNGTLAYANV